MGIFYRAHHVYYRAACRAGKGAGGCADSGKNDLAQLGLNGDNTQGTSSDYSSLSPITISLWIDKKTYYPVKQTIDMKDFMNEYLSSLVADSDMSYSKIKTSVTYKNFNKATKFSLPKACK